MPIFKPIEANEATGKVKEIYDDIKSSRHITEVPNFWRMLANDPNELERSWNSLKQVMKKGATDEMLNEMIAVVGMANETNRLVEGYQVEVDDFMK